MAKPEDRSLSWLANTWVQTIGIIIAAAWGAYTFYVKEIAGPRSAPVNVNVGMQFRRPATNPVSATGSSGNQIISIEMTVSAMNPSTRPVYLLPSAWIAHGIETSHSLQGSPVANWSLPSENGFHVERHATDNAAAVIAVGQAFTDSVLKPQEKIERTLIFHVPPSRYGSVEVIVCVPTMQKENGAHLEWKLESGDLHPSVYRVKDGVKVPMQRDKHGGYSDAELELQQAHSRSRISLRG